MSSNQKRLYEEKKVTIELIKEHPIIMHDFTNWYAAIREERDYLPTIDNFFKANFSYFAAIWWDYFKDAGIDIVIGEDKAYVFYIKTRNQSKYPNLATKREIFYITSDDYPSIRFEEAVAELICRINKPF